MDDERRRRLARATLDGYRHGPDAQLSAAATALDSVESARCAVIVEGISDQIAFETLAAARGRDLEAEGVVVVPVGGAHAFERYLARLGPGGSGLAVAGLCDAGEEDIVRRALVRSGVGTPQSSAELEDLGFFVCVEDLEDALIRAVGPDRFEALLASRGDLTAFRTLQQQPAWHDHPFAAQAHRWLRAGARRNLRYARLLVDDLGPDQAPVPLDGLLRATARLAGSGFGTGQLRRNG
ncbi:MAG: TOPRIM nucleotidyl transferase/hydrolase domain-containing protein [Actinomycetota bacterium]